MRIELNIQKFASGTINFTNSDSMYGKIEWSSVVQGSTPQEKAQLNKSTVTAILYVKRNDGYTTTGNFSGQIGMTGSTSSAFSTYLDVGNNWYEVGRYVKDVSHNNDGTKSITIDGWITGPTGTSWAGKTVSGSGGATLDRIPRYASCTQNLVSRTETSITMSWSSDSTCDYVWYSTNNGSNWTAIGSVNSTTGSYTITGLTANTHYEVKTRVRRKDSQLTTDSDMWGIGTYNYPNCNSAPNFTLGNNVELRFYNPLNRQFTIKMWSYASSSFVSDSITVTGTSYTFTADTDYDVDDLYDTIPNAKSSKYNIDCTCDGHTLTKVGGTYNVNETVCTPQFNDFTYADTNATTTALTGNNQTLIQNYSNVQATVSTSNKATAQKGASMVKYNLVIGSSSNSVNYSSSSSVNVSINNVSSNIINLYAEDSRGLTTPVTKTATLKAYTPIQKGNISITRANNVGTTTTLTYNGTLWGESFGSVTNTGKSARYRYKKTSDADYSGWNGTTTITPTTSGNNYSFSGGIAGDLGNTGFSAEYSFNIEVEVFDELSSTVFSFTLGTGVPHIAIDDSGVAIKQPYNTTTGGALQVNGKTTITGDESVSGDLTTGTFNGKPWDFNTNNTTDTWVPVAGGGKWQHRAIPTAYNSTSPTLVTVNATNGLQVNGTNVVASGTGYVKYYDGTMICYGSKTGTTTYSDYWGFVKRSPEGNSALQVTMAQSFVNTSYYVSVTPMYGKNSIFCTAYEDTTKAKGSFRVGCFKAPNDTGNAYGFYYIAIGKWK